MKFLLDVNALLAWWHRRSPHHSTFHAWIAAAGERELATCAITELGFIRVSMNVFGYSLAQAREALVTIKRAVGGYVEACPPPDLPDGTTAGQTTDAYLVQLAAAAGLSLATFDTGIPDATIIH